jgi:Flp pilus assembly protein TadD
VHCQAALRIKADSLNCHHLIGVALYNLRRYFEAAGAFEAAVRLAPGNAMSHLNLGRVYLKLGQVPNAQREYTRRF